MPAVALALLLTVSPLVFSACSSDLPKSVVAQVGTTDISQADFDKLESMAVETGKAPDKDKQPKEWKTFEQSVADYLVTMEVLRQKAPDYGISITEEDAQKEIDELKQMFQGDEKRFDDALKTQSLTLDQLTRSVADQLLFDAMKAAVTKDVTVADDELKAYYDAHTSEFSQAETRHARHVLIKPMGAAGAEPTETDWEEAKAQAEKVRAEIMNGLDFAAAAKKYSDDATTKDKGGDLGTISRGQMVPAFEEAVFGLTKNEISQPVRTQYGYHIIQVIEINPEKQESFDQVKETLRGTLLGQKQDQVWSDWLKQTKTELKVVYREGLEPAGATAKTQQTTSTSIGDGE